LTQCCVMLNAEPREAQQLAALQERILSAW
jgi:hypothetical protein